MSHFGSNLAPATLLLALLAGCGDDDAEPTGPDGSAFESVEVVNTCAPLVAPVSTQVNLETDVTYATQGGETQRLDVAWPTTGGPHPLVVLVHGGGWSEGSKNSLRNEMLVLAGQGYTAASVGYRLASAPRNIFPAAAQDVRCAVRWLRAHAADYDIDASHVGAFGVSAGAHLASLLGTASNVAGLDGACPESGAVDVDAVLSYSGPHDLRVNGPYTPLQAAIVSNFLGVFPGDAPATAALASPIVHISADDAAFLLVHGSVDNLVPVAQSRNMREALHDAGVRATLIELPGVGHTFFPLGSGLSPQVGCTAVSFFESWL